MLPYNCYALKNVLVLGTSKDRQIFNFSLKLAKQDKERRITMYHLRNLKQNNIGNACESYKLLEKPSMDTSMHWLNPLFIKCKNK